MKKKKKVAILSSTLLATVLVTSPVSASSTTLEDSIKDFDYETVINTYYSSIPEEVKNIKGDTKKEFNKEFLTDEEINQITPDIIKSVYNKIEENPRFNSFNDLGTNKLVADLFRDEIKNSESGIGLNWSLPGYDNLTDEEKKLAKSHPLEFAKYADAALYATSVAEDYYAPSELYQGNGDAFRLVFGTLL
ncbi:hypothetical protein [Ornithinibacillus sp. FSL M8-0202]|uniref:hypothetical protein n=1 Tax=unclassified Ornithinibacillus TaxID=2620869 RepID=UPI0030D607EB